MRYELARYGLALALSGLALLIRGVLPIPEGAAIYQLPLAAVVLSAWYGGRGPGWFASLICIMGSSYWFVPPVNSFETSPEHVLPFSIFIALCLFLTEFSAGRRHVAHALRVSDERFRALVQFSFDVYWETDAEHRFTRQEFSEGLIDAPPRGAEIGKTRWEIPYVEPDEEAWRNHRATLDAHLAFRDFELGRPNADGSTRYVSVSGIPAFDQTGRFVGYRGVGRHITERKRAEEEHRAHLWFLESMDRVNRAMQGTQDLQQMMSDVLLATLDIFACDRAWLIYPCDPDAASWHAVMEHTRPEFPGIFALQAELPVDADIAAIFTAARAASGAVLFGPDYDLKIPAFAADRFAVRSQMAMAIDAKADRPYLFGLHQCSRVRVWSAEEQRLFQEIGRRLSDAIAALSSLGSLRDSQRKLDAAQRIAHVGWWERDFRTNRVALSDEVQRIFGVRPVDLPHWQDRWTSLIHPEDRARTAEAADAAVRGGPRYDVEYRVVRPDGTVRVVHSQGDVVWDGSDRPLRQFGVLQDITELRQSEDALSEVRERFRVLSESSLTGIYLTDNDRFTYVNPALAKMFGYQVEEIVGLSSMDLTYPDDRPLVGDNMRRRLRGDVEELRYEFRGLRKDGSSFPVEVHGRRVDHGGQTGVLGTLVDNTERKRAEDRLRASEGRFRTFVDHATDAFFLMNEQLAVVDVNRQACENLGLSRTELIGMHPGDFDVSLDQSSIAGIAERARAGQIVTFETRHRRRDGTTFPVEIRTRTFKQDGELFYLALARDISERKLAEDELRQKDDALQLARTELERVSRLTTMGELTASVAHEVSQPLGAMVAGAGACVRWLAATPPAMAEARSALDNIVADGKRAREIIGRIRALAKRQAPRMELLDLNRKILEVLRLTEQELRTQHIVLETDLDATLPQVTGDRVQLQQVLLNLIVNAIEAMSAVTDRPRSLTIVSAHDGDGAVVEVRDSGVGFGSDPAERVFEAFYTTKNEGIGIGLSISRSIVEAHSGQLLAVPNEPYGAIFRLSLPLAEGPRS
jgi:PAS domain S-box-containing protein